MIRGRHVVLRELGEGEVPALTAILQEPEVARWFGRYEEADVREEMLGQWLAVELDGELVGTVVGEEEDDPDYRHAGIDVGLTTRLHGRGLGFDTVRTMAAWLFEERGHHRLTIDPAAANARAIRCYERVGFRPVGIMRDYERGADGRWRDGLLMDMLRHELAP
jgi:aminoglycoside 6'-N-acetyltransferase